MDSQPTIIKNPVAICFIKLTAYLVILTFISCKSFKEVVIKDKQQWRADGLNSTASVIKQASFPTNSSLAIFVPKETINTAIKSISGTQIRSVKKLNNWTLKVDSVNTSPENGVFFITLHSSILNPKKKKRFAIDLEAQLTISGLRKTDTSIVVKYEVLPVSINPKTKIFAFNLQMGKYKKVLADLAAIYLHSKNLTSFEISIKDGLKIELAKLLPDKDQHIVIDKDENWFVDLKTSLENTTIRKYLHLNQPAFIKSGIWLSFLLSDTPMTAPLSRTLASKGANLRAINDQMDNDITGYVNRNNLAKTSTYLWINKLLMTEALDNINVLDAKKRTVHINSQKIGGYLSKKVWKNSILGDGEFSARFEDLNAVKTSILLEGLKSNWDAKKGLDLSLNLKVDLKADVHLHVDPYIGGGVGTKVGILGSIRESFKTNVTFKLDTVMGYPVVLARPTIPCTSIGIKAVTDDKFKFDYGWTKIPSFGITVPFEIENNKLSAVSVLSSVPRSILLKKETYLVSKSDSMVVTLPYQYLIYATVPKSFNLTESGIETMFNTNFSFTNDSTKVNDLIKTDSLQLLAISLLKNTKLTCKKEPMLVHAAGVEFGPNNEILKFLGNSWNDIIKGPGDNNEIVKIIDAVGDMINDTTPLDDITYKFFETVSSYAEKNLGESNEITKALKNVSHEIDKFRKTPGKAIGDIPKNIINEGGKTLKKLAKKAKRCFGLC